MGKDDNGRHPLTGRTLYIPRMSTGGAEAMAAAFRSLGVDARVSPRSDDSTLALSARHTTGEECLPQRVVLGNFLKVMQGTAFDPGKTAFLLPTSSGPCRFGQYAPFLRKVLGELGYEDVLVFSPTSSDGYEGIAANKVQFMRTAWRAVVVSDILRKLLLMFRPYEGDLGTADALHDSILKDVCDVLSNPDLSSGGQNAALVGVLENGRDSFLQLSLKEEVGLRPVIGAVGEIYLRFNSFSNQDIIRRIEAQGGEVWIAGIAEWVWYTNSEEKRKLRYRGKRFSKDMLATMVRHGVQHMDEKRLLAPFKTLFSSRQDVCVKRILQHSKPYLPQDHALGEMTLNAGNAIAFQKAGCDGVVDISPFTCMNGIVTEVVYPYLSREYGDIPMRIFYFDGVPFDLDGDLEIFMEQVKSYRMRRLGNPSIPH